MNTLTSRQQQILDYIQQRQQTQGETPTRREIARHFAFASPNAVSSHLRLLMKKGVLRLEKGRARSLRILSPLQAWRGPLGQIPIFGSIPAGFAEAREAEAEGCVTVDVTTIGYKPTKNSFALRVSGESMIGRHILNGDLVILEHGPEPRTGDVVAALIDGNCTLKTYVVKGGKPYLRAENPKYPDLLPARELVIQGVMRALIRPVHSAHDTKYCPS